MVTWQAESMLQALTQAKAARATPLPSPPQMDDLHEWLYSVRLRSLARDGALAIAPSPPPTPSRNPSSSSSTASAATSADAAGDGSVEAVSAADYARVCSAIAQLEESEGVTVREVARR